MKISCSAIKDSPIDFDVRCIPIFLANVRWNSWWRNAEYYCETSGETPFQRSTKNLYWVGNIKNHKSFVLNVFCSSKAGGSMYRQLSVERFYHLKKIHPQTVNLRLHFSRESSKNIIPFASARWDLSIMHFSKLSIWTQKKIMHFHNYKLWNVVTIQIAARKMTWMIASFNPSRIKYL